MANISLDFIPSKQLEDLIRRKLYLYFPMCLEYFNKDPTTYAGDSVEWFQVVFTDVSYVPAALVCFKEMSYYDEREQKNATALHISALEVAKPCRGNGRGSEIMEKIIDIAAENGYRWITLQLYKPELRNFYSRFGFYSQELDGIEIMKLKVTI